MFISLYEINKYRARNLKFKGALTEKKIISFTKNYPQFIRVKFLTKYTHEGSKEFSGLFNAVCSGIAWFFATGGFFLKDEKYCC